MPNSQRKLVKCAVRGCKISDKNDVPLHPFPNSPRTLYLKWVKCCSTRNGWKPGASSAICSKHFEPSSFQKMPNNQLQLLEGAVPTLFLRGENQVCRVCLAVEDSLHPIAESGLKHMYEQCCGLSILAGVSLPQQVCSACVSRLQAAWSLRTTAQRAYMILVKLLTQEIYSNKTISEIVQQGDGDQYKMAMGTLRTTNNFEFVDITQQQQTPGQTQAQQMPGQTQTQQIPGPPNSVQMPKPPNSLQMPRPPNSFQMPGPPRSQQMPEPPKSQQMLPPSRLRDMLSAPMLPISIPPPYKMPQQQQMLELPQQQGIPSPPQPQEDRRAYRSTSPTEDADKVLNRNVPPTEPVTNIDDKYDSDVIVIDVDEETDLENVKSEETDDMIDIVEHELQPETDINMTDDTELDVIKPVTYIIRNDQDETDLVDLDLTQDVTDESVYDSEATESADEADAFMSDVDSITETVEYEFVAVPNTGIAFTVVDEIKPERTVSNDDAHFTARIENVYSIKEENTKKLLLGDYNDNLNGSDWKKVRKKNIST